MGFRKEDLDFLKDTAGAAGPEREAAPRRSFNLEDLHTLDPSCRQTVSIDLSGRSVGEAQLASTGEFEIQEVADFREQTLIKVEEAAHPLTLIQDALPVFARARGKITIVGGGILLGFVTALSVLLIQHNRNAAPMETAARQVEPQVVSAETALETEMFTVPQNEIQERISVQESVVVPESGIVEYARSQTVQIAPRQFLYASGTQRTYGATLEAPNYVAPPAASDGVTTNRNLKRSGGEGRYVNDRDGQQWQGDWKLNAPGDNISRAESYSGYINSQQPSSLNSLNVVQQPKNGLLKGAAGARIQPKLSR